MVSKAKTATKVSGLAGQVHFVDFYVNILVLVHCLVGQDFKVFFFILLAIYYCLNV